MLPGYLSDPNRLERVGALDAETSGVYFRTARPMAQDEDFVSSFRRPLKEVPLYTALGLEWVKVESYILNILNSSCVSDGFSVGVCLVPCTDLSLSNAQRWTQLEVMSSMRHSLSHFVVEKHPWCYGRWSSIFILIADLSWCCHMFSWEPPLNLTSFTLKCCQAQQID